MLTFFIHTNILAQSQTNRIQPRPWDPIRSSPSRRPLPAREVRVRRRRWPPRRAALRTRGAKFLKSKMRRHLRRTK